MVTTCTLSVTYETAPLTATSNRQCLSVSAGCNAGYYQEFDPLSNVIPEHTAFMIFACQHEHAKIYLLTLMLYYIDTFMNLNLDLFFLFTLLVSS